MPTLTVREHTKKLIEQLADMLHVSQSRIIELGAEIVKLLIDHLGLETMRDIAFRLDTSYLRKILSCRDVNNTAMYVEDRSSIDMYTIVKSLQNRIEILERKIEELSSKIDKSYIRERIEKIEYKNESNTEKKHDNNILMDLMDNPWINILRSRQ